MRTYHARNSDGGSPRRMGSWETDAMPYLFEAGGRSALSPLPGIVRVLDRVPHERVA